MWQLIRCCSGALQARDFCVSNDICHYLESMFKLEFVTSLNIVAANMAWCWYPHSGNTALYLHHLQGTWWHAKPQMNKPVFKYDDAIMHTWACSPAGSHHLVWVQYGGPPICWSLHLPCLQLARVHFHKLSCYFVSLQGKNTEQVIALDIALSSAEAPAMNRLS